MACRDNRHHWIEMLDILSGEMIGPQLLTAIAQAS
jgi:hypothetical protein